MTGDRGTRLWGEAFLGRFITFFILLASTLARMVIRSRELHCDSSVLPGKVDLSSLLVLKKFTKKNFL